MENCCADTAILESINQLSNKIDRIKIDKVKLNFFYKFY